jgi:hypothetical protein
MEITPCPADGVGVIAVPARHGVHCDPPMSFEQTHLRELEELIVALASKLFPQRIEPLMRRAWRCSKSQARSDS